MGDLVELDRKHEDLTVDEVLSLVEREEFNSVMVIGLRDDGITVWVSKMNDDRAYWLASKAAASVLRSS